MAATAPRREKPQKRKRMSARVVEDEEYQLRHEKVAGIDVAKASGIVCTRLPPAQEGGRRRALLEEVDATVPAITGLAGRLLGAGVEVVSMESASDYWRVWVRREAHCRIARAAGGNWRRCSRI